VTVLGNNGDDVITGGDGDDTIDGGDGDDAITGGDGDDTIDGGGGDDIIAAGTGDDTIAGGEGDDIVTFVGSVQDYTFESSFDGRKITIARVTDGDATTVTGVETLRFNDGDIRVSLSEDGLVLTGDVTSNITIAGRFPVTVNTA
jgi:Ca2+-binding RTX toxin-like protein